MKKQTLILVVFYLVAAALTIRFFQDTAALRELRQRKADILRRIGSIEQTSEALRRQIDALKHDPYYIQKTAREELGVVFSREVDPLALAPSARPLPAAGGISGVNAASAPRAAAPNGNDLSHQPPAHAAGRSGR